MALELHSRSTAFLLNYRDFFRLVYETLPHVKRYIETEGAVADIKQFNY